MGVGIGSISAANDEVSAGVPAVLRIVRIRQFSQRIFAERNDIFLLRLGPSSPRIRARESGLAGGSSCHGASERSNPRFEVCRHRSVLARVQVPSRAAVATV